MLGSALWLIALVAGASDISSGAVVDNIATSASINFTYPDGGSLHIQLVGAGASGHLKVNPYDTRSDMPAGEAARIVYVPKAANTTFLRYQGFINASALETVDEFIVERMGDYTLLSRPDWALNVSHLQATTALIVDGVVVSRDTRPPVVRQGADCDPPGWKPLAPGIAVTVASSGSCVQAARTLSPSEPPPGVICCTSYQDPTSGKPTTPCALACPAGQIIQGIRFADYGTATGTCGHFQVDAACTASDYERNITAYAKSQCLNRTSCAVSRQSWGDPCRGVNMKRLTLSAQCGPAETASPTPSRPTGVQDESVFGFGQSISPGLSAVGSTKFIATYSKTTSSGPCHAPAPFYVSVAKDPVKNKSISHGLFLNTHGYSAFDVGATASHEIRVSSPDPVLDYFLFPGPAPSAVVGQYTGVTGRMSLPPKWAMGLKYDPYNKAQNQIFVEDVVKQFSDHGIPLDRVILEPAWQGAQYTWDRIKYPDIKGFINHIAPTKLILWEHPILSHSTDFYANLSAHDCLGKAGGAVSATPPGNSFSDLTLVKCQQLWTGYQLLHAIDSGAVGFKLDEDDVDVNVGFLDSTEFPSGFKGFQFHNIQGYIWQRLFHEMFASRGQRTWLQSRGNFAGGQAYPTNSYSDGYTYQTYVRAVVNSGFSGLTWAPEMRYSTCDSDFARRTQLMFLSAQAQLNAWNSLTPGPGVPWSCGTQWMQMFKTHYDLRANLSTYLYTGYEQQSRTGLPLTRALVMDSPDDEETWNIDDQYMLGNTLMVAPGGMTTPNDTSRRVYFPTTTTSWHSYFGNETYTSGKWYTVPTPIMSAPLFVKEGTPISFGSSLDVLGVSAWHSTKVPHTAWTDVYDDDGETFNHTNGAYWRAQLGYIVKQVGEVTLEMQVQSSERRYSPSWRSTEWTIHRLSSLPLEVSCQTDTGNALAGVHWNWHVEQRQLLIRLPSSLSHRCVVKLSSA